MFEVGVIDLVALVPLRADDAFLDDADVPLTTVFVAALVAGVSLPVTSLPVTSWLPALRSPSCAIRLAG